MSSPANGGVFSHHQVQLLQNQLIPHNSHIEENLYQCIGNTIHCFNCFQNGNIQRGLEETLSENLIRSHYLLKTLPVWDCRELFPSPSHLPSHALETLSSCCSCCFPTYQSIRTNNEEGDPDIGKDREGDRYWQQKNGGRQILATTNLE